MSLPSTDAAGANVASFVSAKDAQVDALRAVIAANLRVALDDTFDEELAGVAVAETFGYPITLDLLMRSRMPALSVFRPSKALGMKGKKQQRMSNFIVRWWIGAIPLMKLDAAWPFLDMAFEVIVETIVGHAMLDIAEKNASGEVVCVPSNSVLHQAGILEVDRTAFRATYDFAVARDADAGNVYPVLDVTFNAMTTSSSQGYPYDPSDLDELTTLCATILESEVHDDGSQRPYVVVKATTDRDKATTSDDDFVIGEDGACTPAVETHPAPVEAALDETLTLPTSGLVLRLDPTIAKTTVDDSGSGGYAQAVSAWGPKATQDTAANRGSIATNPTMGEVLRLDDTSPGEWLDLSDVALTGGKYTMYFVIDPTDTGLQDVMIGWASNAPLVTLRQYASLLAGVYDGTTYRVTPVGADGPQILRVTIEAGVGVSVHRNGVLVGSGPWPDTVESPSDIARLGIDIAGTKETAAKIDVRAVYVYATLHDAPTSSNVEAYAIQETPGLAP